MIDVAAKEGHFVDHLEPVWRALPPEARGTFYWYGRGADRDIPNLVRDVPPMADTPTLVASAGDLTRSRKRRRPTAIMEHGCGQSFGGDPSSRAAHHSSYAGGHGRDAQLFLHPGLHPAARDRIANPRARIEVVGCPKLDTLPRRPRGRHPVVAIGFHWDCRVCWETRSGHHDFGRLLDQLSGFEVIGTEHPRAAPSLAASYARHGIEFVGSFAELCRRADVYLNDCSSTLFEFASTGRPVVVLNASYYRRNVNHGLRFWDAATVGVQVTPKGNLADAVREALEDSPAQAQAREDALDLVYAYRNGAAERAAAVLMDWAAEMRRGAAA